MATIPGGQLGVHHMPGGRPPGPEWPLTRLGGHDGGETWARHEARNGRKSVETGFSIGGASAD